MSLTGVMAADPKISIAIFSVTLALMFTLTQKYFINQEHLKSLKKKLRNIGKKLKETDNPKTIQKLNAEISQLTIAILTMGWKKLLFILFVPIILFFAIMGYDYAPSFSGGCWTWYFLAYFLGASIIFRKLFKVEWQSWWECWWLRHS